MIYLNLAKRSFFLAVCFFAQPHMGLAKSSGNFSVGKPFRLHDVDDTQTMDMENGCSGEFLLEEGRSEGATLKIFIGGGRFIFSPQNSKFSKSFSRKKLREFGELKGSIYIGRYALSLHKDNRRRMNYDSYPTLLTVSLGKRRATYKGYWLFDCD